MDFHRQIEILEYLIYKKTLCAPAQQSNLKFAICYRSDGHRIENSLVDFSQ